MENNNKELRQRVCSFSKAIDVDLDYQENLEPYNDEMLKILRSSVTNTVLNSDYNNGILTVHGKSKIQITYFNCNDKGLSTVDFDEDFEKCVNIDCDSDNPHFDICVRNKYNNARIINPTRVDIHNSFVINIKAYCEKSCPIIVPADDLLLKQQRVNNISYISSAYIKNEFEDEALIPADSGSVNRVINVFSNATEEETKIVDNKMLVKSRVSLSILYLTDDNSVMLIEKTVNVNSILDIQGIKEEDISFTDITVSSIYIKPKADKNNEYRSLDILGELNISSRVYRNEELIIPVDAYSIDNDIEAAFSSVELNTDFSQVNETVTEKISINAEKTNITEVLDVTASVGFDDGIEVTAFIADENGNINLLTSRIKTELSNYDELSVNILSSDYIIVSDKELEVRVNLSYKALKFNKSSIKAISGIKNNGAIAKESPALTVYFADSGEELWSIAKQFRTSVELIKKENELSKEIIDSKRIIIIPGM